MTEDTSVAISIIWANASLRPPLVSFCCPSFGVSVFRALLGFSDVSQHFIFHFSGTSVPPLGSRHCNVFCHSSEAVCSLTLVNVVKHDVNILWAIARCEHIMDHSLAVSRDVATRHRVS